MPEVEEYDGRYDDGVIELNFEADEALAEVDPSEPY